MATDIKLLIEQIEGHNLNINNMTKEELVEYLTSSKYKVFDDAEIAYKYAYKDELEIIEMKFKELIFDKNILSKLNDSECSSIIEYICIQSDKIYRLHLGKYRSKYYITY